MSWNWRTVAVAIGVYRIYLGCTWTDAAAAKLVRGFDAIPGFLYRIDRMLPEPDTTEPGGSDAAARRSLIRISMTQAHAMLVLAGDTAGEQSDTDTEIDLASHGFRRRLPVIEISQVPLDTAPLAPGIDMRVGFDATDIACAVQQAAEQSGADWRAQSRMKLTLSGLDRRSAPSVPALSPTSNVDEPRSAELPLAEITHAFETLRARRNEREQPR